MLYKLIVYVLYMCYTQILFFTEIASKEGVVWGRIVKMVRFNPFLKDFVFGRKKISLE